MNKGKVFADSEQTVFRCLRAGSLIAVCAVMLSGCVNYAGIEPEGEITAANTLQAQETFSDVHISPAAWPTTDWWNALGDPELDKLIHEALANSPDMEIAEARLRQANAAAEAAGAGLFPTVNGTASVRRARLSRSEDPQGVGERYGTTRILSTSFNYDADLWGGNRAAWTSALGQARASEVELQASKLALSTNVARAYVRLANAYTQRDLARRQLERSRRINAINQALGRAGLQNQSPQLQSRSSVSSAQQNLSAAEQSLQSAQIQLAVLLGKGPDRGEEIPRPAPLTPALMALPSTIPAELLGRRPDIVAARWRVEAATLGIKQAKAQFYPNLNLSAMAGFRAVLGDYMFGPPSKSWNIQPAITLPIFDAGRLRANLKSTDAQYDLAVARYNQTVINALGDVSTDITTLQAYRQQVQDLVDARNAAQQGFELSLSRYKAGLENYVSVLSSQQQLLNAEQQLANLKTQQIDTSIQLVQALGGGFRQQPAIVPTDNGVPVASTTQVGE